MDRLSLIKGKPLNLLNGLHVKHPTLLDIENLGENKYYEYLSCLTSTSIDVADILWFDIGVWYEDIKNEWDFFLQKCLSNSESVKIRIKRKGSNLVKTERNCISINKKYIESINFFLGTTGIYIIAEINGVTPQKILYNATPVFDNDKLLYYFVDEEKSMKFTDFLYRETMKFLMQINWISKDYDFLKGGTKGAKKYILKNIHEKKKKKHIDSIDLGSITSSLISKSIDPDFVWNMPIYLFYDVYYRLMKIDEYNNTINAFYNGCIDAKKNPVNWEKINWTTIIK